MTSSVADPWWREAVVYQIYPRSFCDTTGNGVGDLEGVRKHLDHLVWLGVDALWLSPVFPSPMADHGYDVADYCDIDALFGSLDLFDTLLAEAHDRDLRVLLDWVPNHTSDEHPWFSESRSSRESPKRDWYIWRDGDPATPPTSLRAVFPQGSAWAWDEPSEAWYLHLFTPQQPDLNWANPEVEAAMHHTLRFWLDRGIDGWRMDVIHMIGKDPDRDVEGPDEIGEPPRTHEFLRRIRRLLDGYDGARVSVGEVFLLDTDEVATYYGDDDELHLCFNFRPQFTPWDADEWREQIDRASAAFDPQGAWPTWVLGNHDISRLATRYGGEPAARSAAVLQLSLRGTPFVYAGDELGLEDADVPPELVQDPGGYRDGCRAPLPWDASSTHGWTDATPWLPWPPDVVRRNVAGERDDPDSMLQLYRRLLAARRHSSALRTGDQRRLGLTGPVVGLERRLGDDRRVIFVNFSDSAHDLGVSWDEATDDLDVEVATHIALEGEPFTGRLGPHGAVILREPT